MRRRKLIWVAIVGLVAIVAVALAGCAGAEGPQGPPGDVADITCAECHNDTTLVLARQVQNANSLHMTGGHSYYGSRADCSICHTSEGFTQRLAIGSVDIGEDTIIENASPINCRTCHEIHETYTAADFALRVDGPVTLELSGDTIDLGAGNVCASCHQPRWSYDIPEVGGGDYEITSSHFGPHYGPQSAIVVGVAGYGAFTGTSVHDKYVEDGCPVCHMPDAYGAYAGGHTMKIAYERSGREREYLVGCETCHSDIESLDRNDVQTEVQALVDELAELLIAAGIMDEDGDAVVGTYSSAQAGALWNYFMVTDDRSDGVHNPQYTKFLLQTAIAALE